jgi:hypothetical protein
MDKQVINLVKTDYDWFSDIAEQAKKVMDEEGVAEVLKIMIDKPHRYFVNDILNQYEVYPQEPGRFRKKLEKVLEGPFAPFIEFRLYETIISPSGGKGYTCQIGGMVEYEKLRSTITLEGLQKDSIFTGRLPEGTTHIPYLFDFVSNCGEYNHLFKRLEKDFVVNRVNLMHTF